MSPNLDIAFFVSSDGKSGTYFRYHNLARALVQRGHEVTIYSQSLEDHYRCREEMREGVRYLVAPCFPLNRYLVPSFNPGNILRRLFTLFQQRRALARHQVFHLFQPLENSSCAWLWWRRNRGAGGGRKPLFAWDWDDLWCGGLYHWEKMGRLQDRWHYRLLEKLEHDLPRLADTVTTCSAFLAERARQNGAREVEVIHNGFWPDIAAPAARADTRRHFSLNPDAYYLGFTGFTPVAIEWCLDLLARFSDDSRVRFVCCGADMEKVIAAQSEAVRARIDYLGLLSAPETHRLLGAIDVGLLPLDSTPFNESRFPIKFVAYLAAGLPTLCSDVGEIGRLARKLDGVVLLPADRQGWVDGGDDAIRKLRTGRMTCRPNPQQLKDNLSWPIMAAQLEGIYLKNRPVPGREFDKK